jgi:hypothetical protein
MLVIPIGVMQFVSWTSSGTTMSEIPDQIERKVEAAHESSVAANWTTDWSAALWRLRESSCAAGARYAGLTQAAWRGKCRFASREA